MQHKEATFHPRIGKTFFTMRNEKTTEVQDEKHVEEVKR